MPPRDPDVTPPETHEPEPGRVLARGSWLFRGPEPGSLADVQVIIAAPADWDRRPEAQSPRWAARLFPSLGLVVAARLDF